MEQPPPTLGRLLREHRQRAGMRQEDLARRAGVSIRTLRDIEQDRVRRPQHRSIQRLVAALRLVEVDHRKLLAAAGSATMEAPQGQLHIAVLGPLSVRHGEVPVDLGQGHLRSLVGLLALQPTQVVGREEIIDVLWG